MFQLLAMALKRTITNVGNPAYLEVSVSLPTPSTTDAVGKLLHGEELDLAKSSGQMRQPLNLRVLQEDNNRLTRIPSVAKKREEPSTDSDSDWRVLGLAYRIPFAWCRSEAWVLLLEAQCEASYVSKSLPLAQHSTRFFH